jgi:hypothetical protein
MKRSIRYRIAKFNRFSMELRFTLQGPFINCWYWWRYPAEWEAAKAMIERDDAARTLYL